MEKKIAIIITKLELGGAQQTALYLAEHLDRDKYEVHLISGAGGYLEDYAKKIPDLNLFHMESFKHPVRPFYDLATFMRLKRYLKEKKIDLVHTHSSKAGFLGRLAASAARVPIIVHTAHGFPFHEYQNPVAHRIFIMLEKVAAKRTDTLIAVGYDVMEYGISKNVGNHDLYKVIHAGVDLEKFKMPGTPREMYLTRNGLNSTTFTVGMIGNLKKQKNPFEFVEIANRVLEQDQAVQFIFGGDGPLREVVQERLAVYGIESKVKFLGWIDTPEDFLHSIDLFLLTSLWEGLPCTLPQAFIAGKPCIATDIMGNREVLARARAGYLYRPGDVDSAARIILNMKNGEEKKHIPLDQGLELEEFDFEHVLAEHEWLYQMLLNRA
jgi:glycosyltransferase involved in cell wall biosynthesis